MRLRQLIPLAALLLAACGQSELYTDLTEAQANEMVATLQTAGIDAGKRELGEGRWSVAAPEEAFARSISILRAQGLPRDDFANLGDLFKKEGFVSSPLEERARLIYGLSQELSNTISQIDGVVQARVHLAMPEPDPLSEAQKPSSASVFIKHRAGVDMGHQVGPIKALVVDSIEGLTYDRVTVALFPAQPAPAAAGGSLPARLADMTGVLVVGALACAGLFAWRSGRRGGAGGRALITRE